MSTLKQVMREANEAIARPKRPLNEGVTVSPADCWAMITRVAEKKKNSNAPVYAAKDVAAYVVDAFNDHPKGRDSQEVGESWYNITEKCSAKGDGASSKLQDAENLFSGRNLTDAQYAKYVAIDKHALAWEMVYYQTLYSILDNKIG